MFKASFRLIKAPHRKPTISQNKANKVANKVDNKVANKVASKQRQICLPDG